MTQQRIRDTCDNCKCEIDMTVAQTVININLRWYKSYSCPFCGSTLELDGDGFPPNAIRKIFLDNEGEWSILFGEQDVYKAAIMKILRQTIFDEKRIKNKKAKTVTCNLSPVPYP